jgi:hypothetical protein
MTSEVGFYKAAPFERGALEGLAGRLASVLGVPCKELVALLGHGREAADVAKADALANVAGLGPSLDHVAIWSPPSGAESWRVDLELEETSQLGVTVMHSSPGQARNVLGLVADYLHLVSPVDRSGEAAPTP